MNEFDPSLFSFPEGKYKKHIIAPIYMNSLNEAGKLSFKKMSPNLVVPKSATESSILPVNIITHIGMKIKNKRPKEIPPLNVNPFSNN
ncbi:MAG: hypothetical protein AAF575_10095 [Bacteroidota bacterium]|nr:hypothetical protein [uncultured Allomuricauda sp.]